MTDRELLELAAKAAGIKIGNWVPKGVWYGDEDEKIDGFMVDGDNWNPLYSDGDALRLAVKLNAHISIDFDRPRNSVVVGMNDAADGACAKESGEDANYATRRAIVRAAAEIGEGLDK